MLTELVMMSISSNKKYKNAPSHGLCRNEYLCGWLLAEPDPVNSSAQCNEIRIARGSQVNSCYPGLKLLAT